MKITSELIVKNSYERKTRDETVDNFLGRLTHVSLVNTGIKKIENVDSCKNATGKKKTTEKKLLLFKYQVKKFHTKTFLNC